jgi:hypothetical protein
MDNEFNEGYEESDLSICLKADTIKKGITEKLELRLQMAQNDLLHVVNNRETPEENDKIVKYAVERGDRDKIDLENQLEKLGELKYRCKTQSAKKYIQSIYDTVKTIKFNDR